MRRGSQEPQNCILSPCIAGLKRICCFHTESFDFMKKLNVGLIGYGFMGRAHSNAFAKVNHFFDLEHQVVLKAACARDGGKVKAFASRWGYESAETDWRKLIQREDIDLIDIASLTNM